MLTRTIGVALLIAVAIAHPCFGCDSVTLQYEAGYPPATQLSREASTLSIERCWAEGRQSDLAVDEYFHAVRETLTTGKIDENWGVPAVDAPYVRVSIELDGRKIILVATAYDDGLRFSLYPTEKDKAYAAGMKRIVKLTLDRAAARYKFAGDR